MYRIILLDGIFIFIYNILKADFSVMLINRKIGDVKMNLSNYVILAATIDGEPVVPQEAQQQEAVAQTQAVQSGVTQASAQEGGFSIASFGGMALYIVGLIALFYFFAIRPQKKKEKELKSIQNSIGVGDWIMTSSGFYGKVVDIADQVFVVEFGTNKGVRIPVRKSEIIGNKEPNLTTTPVASEIENK